MSNLFCTSKTNTVKCVIVNPNIPASMFVNKLK